MKITRKDVAIKISEYFLSRLGYHANIVVTDISAMAVAES
jgi:hypothetical protein